MRILIVDDERPARDKLRRMLAAQTDISEISEAQDAVEALAILNSQQFDVLFLDIQMPEITGLELAASLPHNNEPTAPLIVFVTAYDQYALAAFDANAIDYLLKPFDQARLQRTLQRLRLRRASASPAPEISYANIAPLRQIVLSERGVTQVIAVEQILWLETADNYVVLHTAHSAPLLRQTLAGLLEKLGERFLR
ncbi:MAG: response regulator transcription factor, partial [Burkholderiales bacterium]|nr:response regulator transcription factor [Burkholderiales bacterium]